MSAIDVGELTAALAPGRDGTVSMDEFADLMRSVNDVTTQLARTHDALRDEVSSLQADLAEANERLRRSRSLAALGEMAAGIAHEIRNPLGAMMLNIGLLREDVEGDDGAVVLCDKVARAVGGLEAVVGDVLSFARDQRPMRTIVEPAIMIEAARVANEALLQEYGITLDCKIDDNTAAPVDLGKVTQAMTNVMRNACEAMADTAPSERVLAILVTCVNERTAADAPRRACVRFEFRDHGSGVPEALLDRLFNPFFTTRATGTGLGLAIVHRIIDAHDGALVIENANPGARVCMSFPLDPPQEPLDTEGVSLDNAVRDRVQQYETTRSIR